MNVPPALLIVRRGFRLARIEGSLTKVFAPPRRRGPLATHGTADEAGFGVHTEGAGILEELKDLYLQVGPGLLVLVLGLQQVLLGFDDVAGVAPAGRAPAADVAGAEQF